MKNKSRQSNFELLRILLIFGVIILHYINAGMGGGLKYVESNSVNYYILMFIVSINACAVNLFILLTGYFLSDTTTRDINKPIDLIVKVMLFSLLTYCIRCYNGAGFSIKGAIASMIPVNYFAILYIVLYIISPYINNCIKNLSMTSLVKLLIICMVLFSVYPTFVDVFDRMTNESHNGLSSIGAYGSQRGYTIIQFILMYIIGACLKVLSIKKINQGAKITILLLNGIAIMAWSLWDSSTAWEYCNPLIVLEAIVVFLVFRDINIKSNKIINGMSGAVFSTFLLHTIFLGKIGINTAVRKNAFMMISHMILSVIVIFIICWIIDFIYSYTIGLLINKISYKWKI